MYTYVSMYVRTFKPKTVHSPIVYVCTYVCTYMCIYCIELLVLYVRMYVHIYSSNIMVIIYTIAFVTIETVLFYSNFIMYEVLATDAKLVKTPTLGHYEI